MTRTDFLSLLGLGAGAALTGCLSACKKDDTARPSNIDFTLDLTDPANAALGAGGGFVYRGPQDAIIVARTAAGSYVAAARPCTHQQTSLAYIGRAGNYHCPNHNAEFSITGTVTRSPDSGSATPLKVYTVTQNGGVLRVTG
ncbi:MAG: Rieske 2Fe-2S domain-containing protein [Hymenobacteraceae bacterium]|nr:Rieske 2Fe-2S domain-containing protein [Hymenobacteraceae bacterium]